MKAFAVTLIYVLSGIGVYTLGGCTGRISQEPRVPAADIYQATVDAWCAQNAGEAQYIEWAVSYVHPDFLEHSYGRRTVYPIIEENDCLILVANDLSPESECLALAFAFAACLTAPQAEEVCSR